MSQSSCKSRLWQHCQQEIGSNSLKIIHVPFGYHPDPIGGTEIYVESLARQFNQLGVLSTIAAPGGKNEAYRINDLPVRRFAVATAVHDLREMYGEGDELAACGFGEILDQERPDLVHLHAFTRGVSLRLVRVAKQRALKVVFTYHTPTVSCQRGTLMRWGNEVCDGKLDVQRCTACTLHALGTNHFNAQALSYLPVTVGKLAGMAGLSGGIWTALRMTDLVHLRQQTFRALMREVDQVVALCQWTKDLLIHNDVDAEKIAVSRHGLAPQGIPPVTYYNPLPATPLRIVFLGRLDYTKGPDLLIRAIRALPGLAIELDFYGILQAGADRYAQQLGELAEGDVRIRFLPPVTSQQVVALLRDYNLLAVPSRCLETGPLVVLEAFAAGTPVIGSWLGGIAELVEHEVNGLLVAAESVEGWCLALRRCYEDRTLLESLRRCVRAPRGMDAVAQEMLYLYERVLQTPPVEMIKAGQIG